MSRNLRIVHCLRSPVGGLFRHVVDLATEQSRLGHHVGIIYDELTLAPTALEPLNQLKNICKFGVRSTKMPRLISFRDFKAYGDVKRFVQDVDAQIVHGHGAKGGAYARLATGALNKHGYCAKCIYTPHGGSLHYSPQELKGKLYLTLEKHLAKKTSGIIFESAYSAGIFDQVIGRGFCADKIIPNGLRHEEFNPVQVDPDAPAFLFVGELRVLKGVDLLLEAMAQLKAKFNTKLIIVGDGPDETQFHSLCQRLKLNDNVTFLGRLPARSAFEKAQCLVVPSRAESFPYIVLEAGAAAKPLIATDVGGIGEIVDGSDVELVAGDDVTALTNKMQHYLTNTAHFQNQADHLQSLIQSRFTVEIMTAQVTDFYLSVLGR